MESRKQKKPRVKKNVTETEKKKKKSTRVATIQEIVFPDDVVKKDDKYVVIFDSE